jgi:flagellar hook-associated protein 1 FlgK
MAITSSAQHGLETGRRALHAQQASLNVTSNNIANANTPGYARKSARLESVLSHTGSGIGTGVDATEISSMRSRFLDSQVRVEQQVLGRWEAMEQALGALEAVFNEPAGAGSSEAGTVFNQPSGIGLSGSLSRFWNAWQDLANVPESGAARAAVRQEAQFMATTLNQYHAQLRETRLGLDAEVVNEVEDVNQILDALAQLNAEIPRASFQDGSAADLKDQRNLLLEQLSSRIDITTVEHDSGQVSVLLSGHNLVEADKAISLRVRQLSAGGTITSKIFFEDDGSLATAREGRLRGLMEVRDQVIPDMIGRLDELVQAMVEEVNALHRIGSGADGSTGNNFFDAQKLTASNMAVDKDIIADLDNIVASADGNSGDNGMAIAISQLRNKRVLGGGSTTIEGFYNTLLGEVGARSKEAQTMSGNHRLFAEQIENRRQSVQGVSLNDEAAQLVLFQRAYQAAARTISIIDSLLETTINL